MTSGHHHDIRDPQAGTVAAPVPRGAGLSLEDFIEDGPLLFPPSPPAPRLAEGTVGEAGDRVTCDMDGEEITCRVAPSCLLAPQPGDRVLVCRTAAASYLLAVLERAGPALLTLPETTRILGGRLTVSSDTLTVVNSETLVRSARLSIKGVLAKLDFTFLTLKARELVRLATHFLSRSKASREEATEAMKHSAPELWLEADETLRARAGAVDVKAEGAAKLDGATVQLG
ncbi:MAG: DUF3540 domain-containing protein [Deltaproteobacteria bacterium]|jgi:hypothetical protein|nr:DUF3540 domain-containing protein [Deltaproteobacteria bacterium]